MKKESIRHAYTYEIFPEKVKDLKDKLITNWGDIKRDLDEFKNWLSQSI